LTGSLPPSAVAPVASSSGPSPSPHRPSSSQQISSAGAAASCGGDRGDGQVHSGRGGRARVLDVDDRGAQQPGVAQRDLPADRLLPGEDAVRGVGEEHHPDVVRGRPGVRQRGGDRARGQRAHRLAGVTAERRHPDARDLRVMHARRALSASSRAASRPAADHR
jgi:hypothetical protein